jgi:hypothetical protein
LTDYEKKTGEYSFQSCAQADYANTIPTSTSTMTMYWNATGQTRISAESHPRLARFFAYQPKEYWRYVSATDMGNISYSYAADDIFSLLLSEGLSCPQSHSRKLFGARFIDVPVADNKKKKAIVRSFNLFQDIYDAALTNTSSQTEAVEQGETLDCLWYDDNFGVDDFNADFRAAWDIPSTSHTMCYNRVQDVKAGRRQVKVRGWKDKYKFHYFTMTDAQLATASDITSSTESAMIDGASASTTSPTTSTVPTTSDATSTTNPTTSDATSTSTTTVTATTTPTTTDLATPPSLPSSGGTSTT